MSRFIKSSGQLQEARSVAKAERISGFTEAELEARHWASALPETHCSLSRPTNAAIRCIRPEPRQPAPTSEELSWNIDTCADKSIGQNILKEKRRKKDKHKKEKKEKINKSSKRKLDVESEDQDATEKKLRKAERKEEKKSLRAEKKALKEEKRRIREVRKKNQEAKKNVCIPALKVVESGDAAGKLQVDTQPVASLKAEIIQELIDDAEAKARLNAPAAPTIPADPRNPLDEAYDQKAYLAAKAVVEAREARRQVREARRAARKAAGERTESSSSSDSEWDNDGYFDRSESPCRLRTDGPMWPTRKGAWRSRAGGAYLPPELRAEGDGSSPEPARYLFPEEFHRFRNLRRPTSRSSSRSSSGSDSSFSPREKARRRARRGSSPVYSLHAPDER